MMKLLNKGFALLELMMGVAILVIVISGLLLSFIYFMLLNESSKNLVTAANDAQYVLEQIKDLHYSAISSYVPPALNSLPNETIALNRTIISNITTVTVNVNWNEGQKTRGFSLSTRIAK